jgi:hypothetical protein
MPADLMSFEEAVDLLSNLDIEVKKRKGNRSSQPKYNVEVDGFPVLMGCGRLNISVLAEVAQRSNKKNREFYEG